MALAKKKAAPPPAPMPQTPIAGLYLGTWVGEMVGWDYPRAAVGNCVKNRYGDLLCYTDIAPAIQKKKCNVQMGVVEIAIVPAGPAKIEYWPPEFYK
jgi:hypothetical protein